MSFGAPMITLHLLPAVLLFFGSVSCDFSLRILHINDFHARFEPVDAVYSSRCQGDESTCLGGISRIYSLAKKIKNQFSNTLVLNAGDNYQGTLWYTLFKWNVTAEFLGEVPFDANVVGNHDFDDTIAGLVPFLKKVKFPSIVANIDMTDEPSLKPLIKKSVVLMRGGRKIGVIGYVLQRFSEMSRTGKLKFSDEATAVAEEASRLKKEEGVDIIIALSHAGIEKDIEVAKKVELLDIIVGGHSHTFMYTGTPPSYDVPKYKYPLVVEQSSKRKVLVVQAGSYSRYLGSLNVTFDDLGEVKDYNGNPILLDKEIPSDPEMDEKLKPWKAEVDLKGNQILGVTKVDLNVGEGSCYRVECNMGNFVADSMVHSFINAEKNGNEWTTAAIALINAGGMRTSIGKGNVTYSDVLTVLPFEGTIDAVSVKGKTLIKAIEHTFNSPNFLQWSGAYMELDSDAPVGQQVKNLKLVCTECTVPELRPVDLNKYYKVLMPSFIYHGGDGFVMFAEEGVNHTVGGIDHEAFIEFMRRNTPITHGIEERINMRQPMKHSLGVSGLPK